ncbi:MAG: hypothetical protein QXJ02_07140 [Candidatus Bathyarchaeia archaeon]
MEDGKVAVNVELPKPLYNWLQSYAARTAFPRVEAVVIHALNEFAAQTVEKERHEQRLRLLDSLLSGLEAAALQENKAPIDLAYRLFKK